MIVKVDHIGVAVNSVEEAMKLYRDVLGLKVGEVHIVADQKVKAAMVDMGNTHVELLESTDPSGNIAKHIERRGEGLHHIALQVSNIEETLRTLKEKGIPLVDEKPRVGMGGHKIAFLHPRGTKALIELVEH